MDKTYEIEIAYSGRMFYEIIAKSEDEAIGKAKATFGDESCEELGWNVDDWKEPRVIAIWKSVVAENK